VALPAAWAGCDEDGLAGWDAAGAVELAGAAELAAEVGAEAAGELLELVEQPATTNPAAVRVIAAAVAG
jgi:hypothetical protein